jgi:very-short-patch-repair endonuclease
LLIVCTSIPQESISQYSSLLQQFRNNGRGIFYAYLTYAKAISENNHELKDAILKQLYENCESKTYAIENGDYGSESPFEEEVYYRLAEKIGQDRLQQQYKIGGFRIDLVVKSKITGKPIIAIECDGAKYHSSNEAYAWDMFRENVIKPYGFIFFRIWSTNWWYSSEKELNKLVAFIQQIDMGEQQKLDSPLEDFLIKNEIIPITSRPETKKKAQLSSIVIVKNPDGKTLKIKFTSSQNSKSIKSDSDGIVSIYEKSPLALAIIGREEGETCQLGMLEVYYELIKVE